MRQTQLAQQYFEINQLDNYLNELQDSADNQAYPNTSLELQVPVIQPTLVAGLV